MNDNEIILPIRVTAHWTLKILNAVGAIFFSSLTIASYWFNIRSLPILFIFGLLASLGIYGFFSSFTTLQVDEKWLTITAPHGIYKIDWSEIVVIEKTVTDDWRFESNDITFAFMGENKCLPVNLNFASNGREEFFRFIQRQITRLKITIKPLSSKWIRPQNTRIHRFGFW